MEIRIQINKCSECKHKSHSGAFTPGGAIPVCGHSEAPRRDVPGVRDFRDIKTKEIAERVFNQRRITDIEIPKWCPLKNGSSY